MILKMLNIKNTARTFYTHQMFDMLASKAGRIGESFKSASECTGVMMKL